MVDMTDGSGVPEAPPSPPKSRRALAWGLGITALVVVIGAGVAIPLALNRAEPDVPAIVEPSISAPPPWSRELLADTVFPEELPLRDRYRGEDLTFSLEGSWTHSEDCPESGRNKETEKFLAECESRIEAVYDSEDGDYRVAVQVFAFPRDEMLSWMTLPEIPHQNLTFTWKAKAAQLRDAFWWQMELAGPFLIIVYTGPNGAWNEESSGVSEELTLPAATAIAVAVKNATF